MTIKEAITLFKNHQRSNLKLRTQQSYNYLLHRFETQFGDRLLESIGPEEIYQFLEALTNNSSKSTRRLRYAQIKAFYNLIIDNCCLNMKNPCSAPILSKSFKMPKREGRKILDKETVDETIYNAKCLRDRLIEDYFPGYWRRSCCRIPTVKQPSCSLMIWPPCLSAQWSVSDP